jgi:flagellar hook protein FlgE
MGIASAFYTALSGLSVNAGALSVIGNNLANLNTIGFKGSSTTFEDLFSTNLGAAAYQGNGNPCQVGLGAKIGAVMQNFAQSTFQSTSNPLDMAMQGQGFFYVALATDKFRGYGHTRAGNFTINQFGYVVDPDGNRLQGYNRDSNGNIDTTLGSSDIILPVGQTVPAYATTNISFTTNLDSTATPPNDRFTTNIQVFYGLGDRHLIMVTYERDPSALPGQNIWQYFVWSPDADFDGLWDAGGNAAIPAAGSGYPPQIVPPVDMPWGDVYTADDVYNGVVGLTMPYAPPPSVAIVISKGKLEFGTDGRLLDIDDNVLASTALQATGSPFEKLYPTGWPAAGYGAAGPINPRLPVMWKNGAAPQLVQWEINTAPPLQPPNFLITQTATPAGTSASKQNGYGAGTVKGLTVDLDGFIIGTFTNGQTYALARVALSIFINNNGLEKIGGNIWKETIASGPASIGTANDVGRGSVLGSHYEMSNVDVADEFTRLIITQRGYQANSRIVTTSDEMMQETLALKR